MRRAAALIRAPGGLEHARVFTHIWLALFGAWPWEQRAGAAAGADAPALVGAAQHLRLRVLGAPDGRRADDRARPPAGPAAAVRRSSELRRPRAVVDASGRCDRCGDGRSLALDRRCTSTSSRPFRPLREHALARAERWIVQRQEADGSWGGIQPPWVYSLIALHLRGYPLDHPVMQARARRARARSRSTTPTGPPARGLPVAGVGHGARDRRARRRGRRPATTRRCAPAATGCWPSRSPCARRLGGPAAAARAPAGWAFEFENDNYPDVDDTAEVVLALLGVDASRPRTLERAVDRGATAWLEGMQSSTAAGRAFDADNTRRSSASCRSATSAR